MAETDGGGLLVQIGVTQARMERELAKLVKDAAKSANDMEKSFTAANSNVGKGAKSAFDAATKGANQATPAIKNTSFATANLGSQLNDIGVQLAGGQSPFLIMLQQGTQITQLFQQTGGSIRGFGSILTGAVSSVLNPFSLLTFAIIAAGGTALQYFGSIVSGGEDANRTIEDQTKLIQDVAKTWADAVPALQAYVDQLERAKNVGDLQQVVVDKTRTALDEVSGKFNSFAEEYAGFVNLLSTASVNPDSQFHALGQSFEGLQDKMAAAINAAIELQEKIDAGTAKASDYAAVQQLVNETLADFDTAQQAASAAAANGGDEIVDFSNAFNTLHGSIAGVLGMLAQFTNQANKALNTAGSIQSQLQNITTGGTFDDSGKIRRSGDFIPGSAPTPDARPSTEGMYEGGTWDKPRKGGGGSKRGANAYKDEVSGIKERTAALRESTAAQAAVNPLVSDYGFALEKAKAEQKLLADAQRSGLAITPQLKEQISELAGSYAQASADAKKLSESQADVKKQAEQWASLEKDVFKGFISDLKEGKSGAEALSNALTKVADKLLDMAVDGLFSTKGKASGGGSGLFGSILGGIGKIFGFATGTANTGGKRGQPAGVVHGQEAVIPLPAGGKVPVTLNTPNTAAMSRGSSRDVVDIRLADDSGRMADIADQQIRTASGTIVKVSVDQSYKTVKGNFASLMTDTQSRNFT